MKLKIYISTFLLILIGCQNDKLDNVDKVTEQDNAIQQALTIIEDKGFNIENYKIKNHNIIIEGDIAFDYKKINQQQNVLKTIKGKHRRHNWAIVGDEYLRDITVYIKPEVHTDWRIAARDAMAKWNEVNSHVFIREVFTSSADIEIRVESDNDTGVAATGQYPFNLIYDTAAPGSWVEINDKWYKYYSSNSDEKRAVIMHEFGHNMGFEHTNNGGGSHIPGTPGAGQDPASVFNSWANNTGLFSFHDKSAIHILYGWKRPLQAFVGNIDNDSDEDIVTFYNHGTVPLINQTTNFNEPFPTLPSYGSHTFWEASLLTGLTVYQQSYHPLQVADVNGDGYSDVIGFGTHKTYINYGTGSGFGTTQILSEGYGNTDGWNNAQHVRLMADVNGDGKADFVGFGGGVTYVALSTGTSLGSLQTWSQGYGYHDGWRTNIHIRLIGDIDGDGDGDIVAFGGNDTFINKSNGTNGFGATILGSNTFAYNDGWRVNLHVRTLADVNGDGKDDIVAFGGNDVFVALSNGNGFGSIQVWSNAYALNDGWSVWDHQRVMVDVNNDGKADIVGFGHNKYYKSLSTGSSFGTPVEWDLQ